MSYSREAVKAITDKVLNMAKADAVEVEFSGGERSATRYANSTITANLIEHDQEVTITVRYGQKSASTTVHQFDDESLKRAIAEAQTLAKQRPDNPELMPLLKPPQDYVEVDAALPAAVNFGPAERAGLVKQSVDVCEKNGVVGSGYIPKMHWTDARANSEGLVRLSPLCRSEPDPDVPDARRHRIGMGRHDRVEGRHADRRRRASARRRRQGARVAQGARDRAWHLHRDSRAASGRALPVADAGVARRASGRRGPQLHERRRARLDQAGTEGLWRQRHDPQRHRQQRPAADADRSRRPCCEAGHLDRKGCRQEPGLRPVLGQQAG